MNDLSSALRTFATANPFSTLEESGRVLSTLLSNLAREDTPKFRRVNLTNAKIKAAVLGAAGACEGCCRPRRAGACWCCCGWP